jgi:hypothetical protein
MELPITHYVVTSRDVIETIFGSLIVIFGLIGSIIIANILLYPIIKHSKNNHLNIVIFCIHIITILLFIMLIKYLATLYIQNQLILSSIFNFCGPIIATSSLFFIYNINEIVNTSLFKITKNKKYLYKL